MKQKKLANGIWQFKVKGLILEGSYDECLARLEVYARMWGI
ncbi:MAG: hypothetical protein ACRDCW_07710 [Sarcina sp.]